MLSIMREQNVRDYVSYDCDGVLCKDCRHGKYCENFTRVLYTGIEESVLIDVLELDKLLSFITRTGLGKITIIAFINSTCIVSCDRCSGRELCGILREIADMREENIRKTLDYAYELLEMEEVRRLYR